MQAMQDQIKVLFEEKELILAQFNEVRAGSHSRTELVAHDRLLVLAPKRARRAWVVWG